MDEVETKQNSRYIDFTPNQDNSKAQVRYHKYKWVYKYTIGKRMSKQAMRWINYVESKEDLPQRQYNAEQDNNNTWVGVVLLQTEIKIALKTKIMLKSDHNILPKQANIAES